MFCIELEFPLLFVSQLNRVSNGCCLQVMMRKSYKKYIFKQSNNLKLGSN